MISVKYVLVKVNKNLLIQNVIIKYAMNVFANLWKKILVNVYVQFADKEIGIKNKNMLA